MTRGTFRDVATTTMCRGAYLALAPVLLVTSALLARMAAIAIPITAHTGLITM